MMLPDRFLGIAEEAGLMVNITRQIILRVCMLAAQWRRSLPEAQFYLSINLSTSARRDPDLSGYVAQVLHDTGVSAALLKFEVTEAALISNVGAAREALERLHQLGVQVMLDDFGTGFSSLNYLQMFPLDYVKIDRPVVTRTLSDRANSGMMSAMLQLASSLGLTAIAENIETEAAADALRKVGCEFGQGYFFSEPVQAEVALQRLRGEPFVGREQMAVSDAATSTGAPPLQSPEDDSPTLMIPIESEGQDELDEGSYWHEQTR